MNDSTYTRIPIKVESTSIRREIILAMPSAEASCFVIKSIPAFTNGVALDDLIVITNADSGEFDVLARSGQVTIRAYIAGTLERDEIKFLVDEITAAGGMFEVGVNKASNEETSLLLFSIGVEKGFKWIESCMEKFSKIGGEWEFGNIYDDDGAPLNWWVSNK